MKRIFDLSLVIMASPPVWVPVLLLVALWVRFRLGSPVFSHHAGAPRASREVF